MVTKKGETKALIVEGQGDNLAEVTTPEPTTPEPEPQPEPAVTPEPITGKGETKSENWEQKYKTLEGMHRQTANELKTLKQEKLNYSEINSAISQVSQRVSEQGETLTLITDILSENAVDNEDLSNRVQQAKQKQADEKKRIDQIRTIGQQMGDLVKVAGIELPPTHEALKPAWEAAGKGDGAKAREITILAIKNLKAAQSVAKPVEPEPDKSKKKVPVVTATPGHVADWKDLSSTEKIKRGLQEHKDND